ncbi:MAG: peptidyl-prolyl cis-trans isomerase [Candidatus Marinimicrobia bacterium]|nr:peptidyl-prolyl cis-trans isomerase [Candidatus Neomarinimicrobiota bacterium]
MLGISLLSLLITMGSCSKNENTLATYRGGDVTSEEFLTRYKHYLQTTGLKDNLPERRKILRSALHEELILQDWQTKALDENADSQAILKQQEEQAILDAWYQEIAPDPGQADPQTLAAMLINEETKFNLFESTHQSHDSAIRAREALLVGKSIPERNLGYISLEDVHPRLSSDIMNMKVGEVSLPIRMGDGYYLVRLADKRIPPMIRPQDFAASRARLQREWQVNQVDSVMDAYTEGVLGDLEVTFDADGLRELFELIEGTPRAELATQLAEAEESDISVCSTSNGTWTLSGLAPHLQETKSEHLAAIIDQADLQKVISGILVRREMIKRAIKENIHERSETREMIRKRQNLWRIKEWQDGFADTVSIAAEYLASQAENGISDTTVMFRDVIVMGFDEKSEADRYFKKHQNDRSAVQNEIFGEDFAPDLQGGGKLGWVSEDNLGQAAPIIFDQALLAWTKPWEYNDRFFVFKSLAEQRVEISANEQRQEIERQVRLAGAPVQLQQALTRLEKIYDAKIYEDRVKEIPYIQLAGKSNES